MGWQGRCCLPATQGQPRRGRPSSPLPGASRPSTVLDKRLQYFQPMRTCGSITRSLSCRDWRGAAPWIYAQPLGQPLICDRWRRTHSPPGAQAARWLVGQHLGALKVPGLEFITIVQSQGDSRHDPAVRESPASIHTSAWMAVRTPSRLAPVPPTISVGPIGTGSLLAESTSLTGRRLLCQQYGDRGEAIATAEAAPISVVLSVIWLWGCPGAGDQVPRRRPCTSHTLAWGRSQWASTACGSIWPWCTTGTV
jgi:hypothetical protein